MPTIEHRPGVNQVTVALHVNGIKHTLLVEPRRTLLDALRNDLLEKQAGEDSDNAALKVVESAGLAAWEADAQFTVVGQPHPRVEGAEKVTGRARYTYDVRLPRQLYARVLRSPLPHARITPSIPRAPRPRRAGCSTRRCALLAMRSRSWRPRARRSLMMPCG
jgi:hypothetical protein